MRDLHLHLLLVVITIFLIDFPGEIQSKIKTTKEKNLWLGDRQEDQALISDGWYYYYMRDDH